MSKVYKIFDLKHQEYCSRGLGVGTKSSKAWTEIGHAKLALSKNAPHNMGGYERYRIDEFEILPTGNQFTRANSNRTYQQVGFADTTHQPNNNL